MSKSLGKALAGSLDEAASTAIERAGKAAAERAAREGLSEIAQQTAKNAAEKVAKNTVERVAREASETAAKNAAKKAGSTILTKVDVDDALKKIAKAVPDETVVTANTKRLAFIRNNPKMIIAGLGVAGIGTAALVLWQKKNNVEFKISKVQRGGKFLIGEDDKTINLAENEFVLTYELIGDKIEDDDYFDFETWDQIELTENDSTPKIPLKSYEIQRVNNKFRLVVIKLNESQIPTTLGMNGKFLYKTDFANQLKHITKESGEFVGSTAGAAVSGIKDGIKDGLGLDTSAIKWVGFAILAIVIFSLIGGLIFKFM